MKNLIRVSKSNEWEWTTNKSVYNKIHKEKHGGCSYCGWNKGCNSRNEWYGGHEMFKGSIARYADGTPGETYMNIKYPSWKLATKNKKQWMAKPKRYKIIETTTRRGNSMVDIQF